MTNQARHLLLNNVRFYILFSSVLFSIVIVAALRLQITNDQVYFIRLQQVYGFVSIFYWYGALIISPLRHVINEKKLFHLVYARRAIGVSAFYFALLHSGVALWGQLGGLSQLKYLPPYFQAALIVGGIPLAILFLMAITSLDSVIEKMTFLRWKWLHQLGYMGGVLAVLHIWMIGTHLSYWLVQVLAFIALMVLGSLELYRLLVNITRKRAQAYSRLRFSILYALMLVILGFVLIAVPAILGNYTSNHSKGGTHAH